jgi:putative ABC transport system permease protein
LVLEDGSVGESVSLLAPPAGSSLVEPILVAGRWIEPGDQNAITLSELFRERYPDLRVGDTLRLKVNGEEQDWVIVGFYQLAGKVSGFSAYTSYEYLTKLTNQTDRAASYRVVSDQPDLTRPQQEILGQAIEAKLQKQGIDVVDITTGKSMNEIAGDGFNVLTAFLLFLALLTALVGSIGLAGTMSLNVMERTREIGVMRAIGAQNGSLRSIVVTEGLVIGVISWLLSIVASFPLSSVVAYGVGVAVFQSPMSASYSPVGGVAWLAIVVVISTVASLIPARRAAQISIREALAYE